MTINETLAAIAKLRMDAATLAHAIHGHLARTDNAELRAFLHRMHRVLHDFTS
jgi:hypothetical protein